MSEGYHLSRRLFVRLSAGAVAATALPIPKALGSERGGTCDPFSTPPSFQGVVPSPEDVLGFPIGVDRETTADEINTYLDAVGSASNRVRVRTLGTSVRGRPIRYALVGDPANVTNQGLAQIQADTATIRDPATPQTTVDGLASTTPVILWIAGNLHGGEESGADASLQLLYELADRDDCGVTDILARALIVIIPTQNPDGREIGFRRNGFAFDLNQDHLVRTQVETEGKLALMKQYPPAVLTDHHEFGYYRSFFPPNDDPVYHETPENTVRQIYDLFGPAFAREFRRERLAVLQRGVRLRPVRPTVHGHDRRDGLCRGGDDDRGLRRCAVGPSVRPAPHRDVVDDRDGCREPEAVAAEPARVLRPGAR